MANIRVDLNHTPLDGEAIAFKAPCDASNITGLNIYYVDAAGATVSQEFTLADANGGDLGVLDRIFAEGAIVKVLLDTDTHRAFVQNADTNAYLEGRFDGKQDKISGTKGQLVVINEEGTADAVTLTKECFPDEMLAALKPAKGTDYWTEEDKAEIVNDVLSALPAAEGVSF